MTDSHITLIWIGFALAASVLFGWILLSRRPRLEYAELGTMNEQWLAEQRANDRPY